MRLHNGARTRWRFSERGLRPLLEKASRGFCSSPGGCQSIPTWLRGDRRSSEAAFLRRIRAPLDCARFSAECTERYRTKRNETKRNGTERYANDLGRRSATLHSGFVRIFAKRNGIELNDFGNVFLTHTVGTA